jgi:hypothetical protein
VRSTRKSAKAASKVIASIVKSEEWDALVRKEAKEDRLDDDYVPPTTSSDSSCSDGSDSSDDDA